MIELAEYNRIQERIVSLRNTIIESSIHKKYQVKMLKALQEYAEEIEAIYKGIKQNYYFVY